jgi:septum site-determining protein MinD
MVKALAKDYDYVFIDAPAGVGGGFELASAPANRALIVSTPDTPCIKDSAEAAFRLTRRGFYEVKLVLNRVVPSLIKGDDAFNIDESMDRVGVRLAGVIFDDKRITAAFNNCVPIMLRRAKRAKSDFFDLAKRLEGLPAKPRF